MTRAKRPPQRGLTYTDSNHTYRLDGKWVPSVTGVLGVLDKPALKRWAAREVAEFVANHPDSVDALRPLGKPGMVKALANVPFEKTRKAQVRGTAFHDYAERILLGEEVEVPSEHVGMVTASLDFMDDWQIEPVKTEASCASRANWHAGRFDLVADYDYTDLSTGKRHHGRGIFDWKSGKAIYATCAFQLNGYGFSEFYVDDKDVEHPMSDLGIQFAWGVHITNVGYAVHPLPFSPAIYDEFVTIRKTWDINKRAEGDWKRPGSGYVGLPITPPPVEP